MRKILKILPVIIIICAAFMPVFAFGEDPTPNVPNVNNANVDDRIENTVKGVWSTITVIVQIASVACVVFAGLRYMFASSDQKADIKQGLIYLTIGAILVFGSTLILNLVVTAAKQITANN